MITPIDSWSVDQITSGQVVTSLASTIKELIENSLDSGASVVDVKLQNYGRDGISVTDNGQGIEPDDFAFIARKHATSKIGSFSDLSKVTSLGFRGEALASICALADVTITTSTGKDTTGHELTFDHSGEIVSDNRVPSPKGTIVAVSNIFEQLPVRRKAFEKNSAREFAKAVALVQEYAILSATRITLEHVLKNRNSITLRSQGAKLMQRIACIYGAMRTKKLQDIEFSNIQFGWRVSGYISKPVAGMGDSAPTCQLLAVNGRPTQQPRIKRAVVEIYKQFNLNEQPFFVLDITMSPDQYDVNVSPDKRSLLFHHEDELVSDIRTTVEESFASSEHAVPRASQGPAPPSTKRAKQSLLSFASYAGTGSVIFQQKDTGKSQSHENLTDDDTLLEATEASVSEAESPRAIDKYSTNPNPANAPAGSSGEGQSHSEESPIEVCSADSSEHDPENDLSHSVELVETERTCAQVENCDDAASAEFGDLSEHHGFCSHENLDDTMNDDADLLSQSPPSPESPLEMATRPNGLPDVLDRTSHQCSPEASPRSSPQRTPPKSAEQRTSQENSSENTRRLKTLNTSVNLPLDLEDIKLALKEASQSNEKTMKRVQTLAIDEEGVEERLQLTIHKQDFETMEVVGQFNLGFILVVNRKASHDDLFVVDQHASDEIYNFERLQSSTTLSRQPLVIPHVLELSAVEELTMQEHQDIFENNGFKISFRPENPPGRQCVLESVPFSKSTVFDEKDVFELLSKLKEEPNQPWLRCSKLRSMFAMRACRSSIMIGRPLAKTTMELVVRHMGSLDKPWNCPHGRPTLRHITSLS